LFACLDAASHAPVSPPSATKFLSFLLALQTFLKRMTRALGRKDMDEARRIYTSGKPAYTLDHLIREVRERS